MRARRAAVCVLALACGSPAGVSVAPLTPKPVAETLESARARWGAVILFSDDAGIHALTPQLAPISTLTPTPGKFLRVDAARAALYFLAPGRLVRFDLRTNDMRMIAKLPELEGACLSGDPVDHVQDERDVVVDDERVCITVRDRNINMESYAVQLRVDLATGAVESQTIFASDRCPGNAKKEWTCASSRARDSATSPSGRWELERSADIREIGDYVYSAALLHDHATHRTYAITDGALTPFASADERPRELCMLAGEAHTTWLSGVDVLLVEGCNNGTSTLVVAPPASVRKLKAFTFAAW